MILRSYGLYMWLPEMFNTMSKFSELHPDESGSICVAYTKSGNATNNIILYDGFLSKLNETYSSGSSLSAGNHSTEECSSVVNPETFQNTLVVGGVSAVLFLLYGFIIDYIGKRNVLWLTLLGASGSGIALDFVSSSVAVVGFSCLVVSLLFTCISVLSAFIVDIFPTHLRSVNTPYFTGTPRITMTSIRRKYSLYDSHSKYKSPTSHQQWSPHTKHCFYLHYTNASLADPLLGTLANSRARQPTPGQASPLN
ncbi:unnamed protein product [Timema podura]|uniref:Uncharacterized protein n=1 Tax=Timema podura TaxID=61482 RepID=A0ABN7PRJ2_TIMPD|nr:unnamed protein product [Timema podura]